LSQSSRPEPEERSSPSWRPPRPPRPALEDALPALRWIRGYERRDLQGDLIAGLIVAVMLIPQGMAYAVLAGLPPVMGLYAATIPLLIYALFGSSRQLAVGPVAIVSIITFEGISRLAEPGSTEFIGMAFTLALMVGVIQFLMGLLRTGFIVKFLSHAVISGFTAAAALIIGFSQLSHVMGVSLGRDGTVFHTIARAITNIPNAHLPTVAMGVGSIAALLLLRRYAPRLPGSLIVVAGATLLTFALNLGETGIRIVGDVPSGMPGLSSPAFDLDTLTALLPIALTISFVGFMESIAIARSIAARERTKVSANQELTALGLANIAAGFFSSYPVTGGFSRTAVNYQAGARTGMSSIVTASIITLTLLFFTSLFFYLPYAVLAAIIIVAVVKLIDIREARHLFTVKTIDGLTLLLTFAATLLLGIEMGILVGVIFSLLVFIRRSAYPHTAELGYLPDEDVFRNIRRYPEAETFSNAVILRIDASLYFANVGYLEDRITTAVADRSDLEWIILDFSGVNDIDGVAVETLEGLIRTYQRLDVRFLFAGMKGPVRDVVARAGWQDTFAEEMQPLSVRHALEVAGLMPVQAPVRDVSLAISTRDSIFPTTGS
jgi:sulfate permease, SulP family